MQKERKKRRTRVDLEHDILLATTNSIKDVGFSNVTLTGIAKKAKIEPCVLYNRYKDLDDLLDKFVRQYDYWFHDLIEFNNSRPPLESMKEVLAGLINALYDNTIMQQLLRWEVTENNKITNRTAQNREAYSKPLLNFFREELKGKMEFDPLASILIAGIYYLILHREISTFCEIDFNTEEGKNVLIDTVGKIVDCVYSDTSTEMKDVREVAKTLLRNGVDEKIIQEATGLSLKDISSLK